MIWRATITCNYVSILSSRNVRVGMLSCDLWILSLQVLSDVSWAVIHLVILCAPRHLVHPSACCCKKPCRVSNLLLPHSFNVLTTQIASARHHIPLHLLQLHWIWFLLQVSRVPSKYFDFSSHYATVCLKTQPLRNSLSAWTVGWRICRWNQYNTT